MKAKDFYQKFIFRTSKNKDILMKYYRNSAEFTPIIMDIINGIIENPDEAGSKEFGKSNEYFRIDASGWKSSTKQMNSEAEKYGLNGHAWDLKIAVEHENSVKDWTDEVTKLIHVKCPLKVIIGYNHCNRRDEIDNINQKDKKDKSDIAKLDFVAGWMNRIEAFNVGTDEEYLIIIGNAQANGRNKKDYEDFDYRGYLYNRKLGKFEQLYV